MTLPAKNLVLRAQVTLQDPDGIRWTVPELVRYLNDGQRELIIHRPDATATAADMALVEGSRQTLPTTSAKLLSVSRNATGRKRAITLTSRRLLDDVEPEWQAKRPSLEIRNYCYDPREPRVFHVYPPAAVGAVVRVTRSDFPVSIAEPAVGSTFNNVVGDIGVPAIFSGALCDYMLHRCYGKDSEHASNAALSGSYYAAFLTALGVEIKATLTAGPVAAKVE